MYPLADTLMRNAIIILGLLFWSFAVPTTVSASPLSLYGPFDQVHIGERAEPDSSVAYREAFSGCGRGRVRDRSTSECKGPADLR